MDEYPTKVTAVSILPNFQNEVYPDWLVKVQCLGSSSDADEVFQAVFRASQGRKRLEASWLQPGMRLRLDLEPFEDQPESTKRLPMADSLSDFSLPVYWVKSLHHEDANLTYLSSATGFFSNRMPGSVVRSLRDFRIGGASRHFYFYGETWTAYSAAPYAPFMELNSGGPLGSVLAFDMFLKKRRITLLFATLPQAASLYEDFAEGKDLGMNIGNPPPNAAVGNFLVSLQEKGVQALDLTTLFRASRFILHEGERYPLAMTNDTHWSPSGARLAALHMAKILRESRSDLFLSQPPSRLKYTSVAEVINVEGDINTLAVMKDLGITIEAVPTLRERIVPGDQKSREILASTDLNAQVHLIGDSNIMVNREIGAGFADYLSKEIDQGVYVSASAGGSYYGAVEKWLQEGGADHAKVVVWLVAERFLGSPGWIDAETIAAAAK